jgi:hypothetical protein
MKYNRGDYKVSQTKRGNLFDRVDFYKEWFRGEDLLIY